MNKNRHEYKVNHIVTMLLVINLLLMISIIGLYINVNKLQQQIQNIFKPIVSDEKPDGLEIGTVAPIFSLKSTKGQIISNQDYFGKNLLIIFYSPKCPQCTKMLPIIKEFSKSQRNTQILMISNGDNDANFELAETEGLIFPILSWDDSIASQYKVPGTPFFYILDLDGKVTAFGFINSLEELITLSQSEK